MIYLDPLDQLRLQRGAEHLHRLGARATAELLAELADQIGGMPATLTQYERRLTPAMLRLTGDDRFPPRQLRMGATVNRAQHRAATRAARRGDDVVVVLDLASQRGPDDRTRVELYRVPPGRVALTFDLGDRPHAAGHA